MIDSASLPPALEQFVRDQVAAGRFVSEADVLRTALRLLEAAAVADRPAPARRSPRGLLADLPADLSFDDIQDARHELWAGPRPGGPR